MEDFGLAYAGFFLGMFLFSSVVRWLGVIEVVLEKRWEYYGGHPVRCRPLAWALPAVLLLHSGPWTLGVVGFLAWHVLAQPHAESCDWFFGGIAAGVGFMAFVVVVALLRWRQAHSSQSMPAPMSGTSDLT